VDEDEARRELIAFLDPNRLRDHMWRDESACLKADVEMFNENGKNERAAAAKLICKYCPVARICLAEAYETEEEFLIMGAMTPRERNAFLKKFRIRIDERNMARYERKLARNQSAA
jgi:hypothetical protein